MNKSEAMMSVLLLLAGSALAQQELPPGGNDFLSGQEAIQRGDINSAIHSFENALASNSDLYLGHYYLGFAHQAKHNWEDAATHFMGFLAQVDTADPKTGDLVVHATRQAGLALARTQNYRRAIPYLKQALNDKERDKDVHFFFGVALLENGNQDKAEKHFMRAMTIDRRFAEAYYYAGRIAFAKGDVEAAGERLAKLLELRPNSPHVADTHYMLGTLALAEAATAEDPADARTRAKTHLVRFLELLPEGANAAMARRFLDELERVNNN